MTKSKTDTISKLLKQSKVKPETEVNGQSIFDTLIEKEERYLNKLLTIVKHKNF